MNATAIGYSTTDRKVKISVEFAESETYAQLEDITSEAGTGLVVTNWERRSRLLGWFVESPTERLLSESRSAVYVCRTDQPWPPTRILCPVDLTIATAHSLDLALSIARSTGATLDVLRVRQPQLSLGDRLVVAGYESARSRADEEDRLERANLDRFLSVANWKGVRRSQASRLGQPSKVIPVFAEEIGSDLVVMGRTRRGLGSDGFADRTVVKVLRRLACPMLTLLPHQEGPGRTCAGEEDVESTLGGAQT